MSTRTYLVQVWRARSYLRTELTAPFLVGCATLFLFFALPPATYKNLAPLFAPQMSAAGKEQNSNARREIAVRVLSMEKNGQTSDVSYNMRNSLLRSRVGINILLRSGYLSEATVENEEGTPPYVVYRAVLDDRVKECVALHSEDELSGSAENMAVAVVAVEKFNRNAAQRWLEWTYLNAYSSLFSRPPNLSVGPAQVRVSQIKQVAADVLPEDGPYSILKKSDVELMRLAANECGSLRLAATLVYYYLDKARNSPTCEAAGEMEQFDCVELNALAKYSGKRWKTNAIIDYGPVVQEMAAMMSQ